MSVYATLNSAKPIPMEIRDSTVRFQTFGQRDNYEAPPVPTPNYQKYRRKSGPTSSPPDGMNLGDEIRGYAIHFKLDKLKKFLIFFSRGFLHHKPK